MRRPVGGLSFRIRPFDDGLQSLEQVEPTRIWTRILAALTEEGWIAETGQIDSSYIKAHRSAGGAKEGRGPMPLASRVVGGLRRSTPLSMSSGDHSASS
jgi:hypothetical protein